MGFHLLMVFVWIGTCQRYSVSVYIWREQEAIPSVYELPLTSLLVYLYLAGLDMRDGMLLETPVALEHG